jgi:hypothetical protein
MAGDGDVSPLVLRLAMGDLRFTVQTGPIVLRSRAQPSSFSQPNRGENEEKCWSFLTTDVADGHG